MSKVLRFTKTEIANAAKVAKEHGVSVKLSVDGSILVCPNMETTEEKDLDRELRAWEEQHGYSSFERAG